MNDASIAILNYSSLYFTFFVERMLIYLKNMDEESMMRHYFLGQLLVKTEDFGGH